MFSYFLGGVDGLILLLFEDNTHLFSDFIFPFSPLLTSLSLSQSTITAILTGKKSSSQFVFDAQAPDLGLKKKDKKVCFRGRW